MDYFLSELGKVRENVRHDKTLRTIIWTLVSLLLLLLVLMVTARAEDITMRYDWKTPFCAVPAIVDPPETTCRDAVEWNIYRQEFDQQEPMPIVVDEFPMVGVVTEQDANGDSFWIAPETGQQYFCVSVQSVAATGCRSVRSNPVCGFAGQCHTTVESPSVDAQCLPEQAVPQPEDLTATTEYGAFFLSGGVQ